MHFNTLHQFRQGLYQAFGHYKDSLFELTDALLTESSAKSLPELSFSPLYHRQWPSLYKALQYGGIDRMELRCLFAHFAPTPRFERPVIGIDATSIIRQASPTARDRSVLQLHNLVDGQRAHSYGWQFSTVVVLPEQPSSLTYVLDQQRIASNQSASQVAAQQLEALAPLLDPQTLLEADRYYGSWCFVKATEHIGLDKLLRVKSDRVFYRSAPPHSGKRGAPRKHGDRFKCNDPTTHGQPDERWQGLDEHLGEIMVERWGKMHFRQECHLEFEVIKVSRPKASGKRRAPRISWFIFVSKQGATLALNQVVSYYKRRYSQEHGYRFDKGALGWERPRLRTPEQFELWSQLVAAVHNEVVLALPLLEPEQGRYQWHSRHRPLSGPQARRALGRIISELGSPVAALKGRGKGRGRVVGTKVASAPRYEIVRKGPGRAKKRPKAS